MSFSMTCNLCWLDYDDLHIPKYRCLMILTHKHCWRGSVCIGYLTDIGHYFLFISSAQFQIEGLSVPQLSWKWKWPPWMVRRETVVSNKLLNSKPSYIVFLFWILLTAFSQTAWATTHHQAIHNCQIKNQTWGGRFIWINLLHVNYLQRAHLVAWQ